MKKNTKGWSAERRAKQAENIQKTKPWTKITGSKSAAGKEISAQNALKSGMHTAPMRRLSKLLKAQADFVKTVKRKNDGKNDEQL